MKIVQIIRRIWCKHPYDAITMSEYAKPKCKAYKGSKSKFRLRYDLYEEFRCEYCGKLLGTTKVRSDLTQLQVERRFAHNRDNDF
jgi:aspartate carbamoyltransferase regulatory subunit